MALYFLEFFKYNYCVNEICQCAVLIDNYNNKFQLVIVKAHDLLDSAHCVSFLLYVINLGLHLSKVEFFFTLLHRFVCPPFKRRDSLGLG